jgi:molecular chaperone Hsp33
MNGPPSARPSEPAPLPDDLVLPFQAESGGATGRVVRLGAVVDSILSRHDYPESVSKLLGEAVALTAMLGASLKFDGTFILQTSTKGPVSLLVVDYRTPGELRGYAHFDRERIEALEAAGEADAATLLGHGHLAMTIDQGAELDRYQGVVPLEGEDLNAAAHTYFRQSEQLPTFLRVAVARHYQAGDEGEDAGWGWRAGGLIIQNVAEEGGSADLGDALPGFEEEDDEDWQRVRLLAQTVEDHELVDPMLSSEELLYRLFHEEVVRVFRVRPLDVYCRCSRERIEAVLDRFGPDELEDMVEDGKIIVTCEFCSRRYIFDADRFV